MMLFEISYSNVNKCTKMTLHKISGIEKIAIVNYKNHVCYYIIVY